MNENFRIYRVLGAKNSVYAELNSEEGQLLTLNLVVDDIVIDSVKTKSCGYEFPVKSSGEYSVTAENENGKVFYSNKIFFDEKNILPRAMFSSYSNDYQNSLKGEDILPDNAEGHYIELKVKKDKFPLLADFLINNKDIKLEDFKKKHINLNSFSKEHSIHACEYYELRKDIDIEIMKEISHNFESSQDVIYCSIVPIVKNPPTIKIESTSNNEKRGLSTTPDFSSLQKYLDAPQGMNIRSVWDKGVTGKLAVIRHLDYGIYKNHEDLQGGNITVVNSRDESEGCNHGTASTGCIAAANNGSGVTGIAHDAKFFFYDVIDDSKMLEQANPGDIVSIDSQFLINKRLVPLIVSKRTWDVIHNLTEKGVIVILAAGNGGLDLSDTSICPDYGDSGVIMIGACDPVSGKRASFSNYGHYSSMLNSWGSSVTTIGYGDLQKFPGNERNYTKSFSGTSSATPLCAGALALVQSYAKENSLILDSQGMREIIKESNYDEGVVDLIGYRPNVDMLLKAVDKKILEKISKKNPFPSNVGYINYNLTFKSDIDTLHVVHFDYQFTDIKHTGVVAHYEEEGPTTLDWYKYGYTRVKVPVYDNLGNMSVIYLRVCKHNICGDFTMNSGASCSTDSGNDEVKFNFIASDNKHLVKNNYSGILPLYIKSRNEIDFSLPVRVNIFIE